MTKGHNRPVLLREQKQQKTGNHCHKNYQFICTLESMSKLHLLKLSTGQWDWPRFTSSSTSSSFSLRPKQTTACSVIRLKYEAHGNSCLTSNHEQHLTWHLMLASHEWTDCSAWFPGLAVCLGSVYATTSVCLVTLQVQILPPTTNTLPGRLLWLCCCEWTRHFPPSVSQGKQCASLLAKGGAGCFLLLLLSSYLYSYPFFLS